MFFAGCFPKQSNRPGRQAATGPCVRCRLSWVDDNDLLLATAVVVSCRVSCFVSTLTHVLIEQVELG